MVEFSVLYSGSSGNCSYIKINNQVFLIDAGVSCKRIFSALASHDILPEQIAGILLTHEHTDHVIGLKQLVDRFAIPLYTNEPTLLAINDKYRPQNMQDIHFFVDDYLLLAELAVRIDAYPISHDVEDGRFYVFENHQWKFVYLTDSGYVPEKYYDALRNANGYIIESNHEPELVMQSRYPWHIQQRIISDKGHLSNQDSSLLMQKIIGERTKNIVLAHLSEENNRPDIAYNRMINALLDSEYSDDVVVKVATKDNVEMLPIIICD